MAFLVQILENVVLLSFIGLGYFLIQRRSDVFGVRGAEILTGLCFGVIAFLVTVSPVQLPDGATVDARAGPVILAGVVAGPIGGLIAACMGGFARGLVGGSFAISGIAVYFVYAIIGIAIRYFQIVTLSQVASLRGVLLLTFASFCGASAIVVLIRPNALAIQWIQQDLPYILLANALSVTLLAWVIGFVARYVQKDARLAELIETLNLAKTAGKFGIWDFDIRSGVLKWDDRSQELHGVAAASFQGTYEDWARNIHPEDLPVVEEIFSRGLQSGDPFESEYRVQLSGRPDRTIKGNAIILQDNAGKARRIVGTNLDLTELRNAEAKLIEVHSVAEQSQKFETIGQLTGGIAHDFNNLLAVIMGNQELLRDQIKNGLDDVEDAHSLIDASIEATKRGAELTRNLLAYARKAQLTPEQTDLNQVVRETEKWLRRTIESRIEIEAVLQAGLWSTVVDRASLQSALVNLIVNARHAVDGSGQVTIETSNIRIEAEYVQSRHEDIPPGRYVMLAVTDNGSGIEPALVDSIFDPFFTTKPVGTGSGLGLSMVQGFVKQSGGAIRVYSELGVGTSFKLYFPASGDANLAETDLGTALAAPDAGRQPGKRVLVVEDQQDVLAILERILKGAGFEVVIAESGDEAFRFYLKDRQFDLVVTDIVMPGKLQGPSLAKEVRSVNPEQKFVFLSGYASEATVHGNGLKPSDIRLMKPVSRFDFLAAVHASLSD